MSTTHLRGNTAEYSIRYYRTYTDGDADKQFETIIGWHALCSRLSDGLLHTDVEIRDVTRNGNILESTREDLERLVEEARA
tara:strand:- start:16926 stop:17168 length:243 start_codon:yes stop_codon:yes gene_type:complete